ncbi:MAG: NUDIX domain-containing protein [Daejeonella sp.]
MYPFNVRVYGLLINEQNQILISDEEEMGFRFSKFPGGGLEYGEGLTDALKREFIEECNTEIEVGDHFYTTDFFIKSAFNESQIISIYYFVKTHGELNWVCSDVAFDFNANNEILQSFRWQNMDELIEQHVTFPTDQKVVELLKIKWKKKA